MSKSNLELFKQAISEGLSNKIDSISNSYTEEIVYSEKHKLSMRTIVYGKIGTKQALSPKMKRVIAIIVAAALLLTSCGIIFRNEIREIIEDFFVKITCSSDESGVGKIKDVYKLTYLPEGYYLKNELITPLCTKYEFASENGGYLGFEQSTLNGSDFIIDIESGYSKVEEINTYDVYYRYTNTYHFYIWNDDKYSYALLSNKALSNQEVILIMEGLE